MTPVEVVLPKVDMDMESGTIAAWHVKEGDAVRAGDILFDMETSKAVMEVESPAAGRIRGLAAITGEPVAVGTAVAWIDPEPVAQAPQPSAPAASRQTVDASQGNAARADAATAGARPVVAPDGAASAVAASRGVDVAPTDARALRATPLARRTARMHGIVLDDVQGSGPLGRIVAGDVEKHAERARPQAANESGQGSLVPFSAVRRIVAQRLAASTRTIPHFYLSAHIEMTALREALHRLAPVVEAAAGVRPTLTVLIAKLVADVLARHPLVNASVEGDAARLHAQVNVGVAMDRAGELVVPVLRDAAAQSLAELSTRFARLRNLVRTRTITPEDMRGGTFTISNLGMYGVDAFTAIINPPECAILAIGRTLDTPVGRDGHVVLRPMATFTLSSDHRIVDGVVAARFVADLRRAVEDPMAHLHTGTS